MRSVDISPTDNVLVLACIEKFELEEKGGFYVLLQ
jgi:hypothetical protein